MKAHKCKTSAFFCIFALFACGTCWGSTPFFPKLVVSGTAALHKPADQVSLHIAVITQADTAEKALTENNDKMQQVINSLQIASLEKGEYHTGQFAVQPIYSTPPKTIPPDWKAIIVAYEVTNSVTVKTQKLELAPVVIDAAGQAGANQISNISFELKEPSVHRSEAIAQATSNALKDAETLANAANLQLVRILDIKLDQPQLYPRPGPNMLYMAKMDSGPFIEPPDVDVTASVSVTFEIATK